MRMWMVDPKLMCNKHLIGEHGELHMLVGHLRLKHSVSGYVVSNAIELKSLETRHEALVNEMVYRGYSHKSPLVIPDYSYLSLEEVNYEVDRGEATRLLLRRCTKCWEKWQLVKVSVDGALYFMPAVKEAEILKESR